MNRAAELALVALSMLCVSICLTQLFFVRHIASESWRENAEHIDAEMGRLRGRVFQLESKVAQLESTASDGTEKQKREADVATTLTQPVPVDADEELAASATKPEYPPARGIAAPMPTQPVVQPARALPAAPVAQFPETAQPVAASVAFLNINSIPPSTCFVDGEKIGPTPQAHVAVKPGPHTVQFVNTDKGFSRSLAVTAAAGETRAAVMRVTTAVQDGF